MCWSNHDHLDYWSIHSLVSRSNINLPLIQVQQHNNLIIYSSCNGGRERKREGGEKRGSTHFYPHCFLPHIFIFNIFSPLPLSIFSPFYLPLLLLQSLSSWNFFLQLPFLPPFLFLSSIFPYTLYTQITILVQFSFWVTYSIPPFLVLLLSSFLSPFPSSFTHLFFVPSSDSAIKKNFCRHSHSFSFISSASLVSTTDPRNRVERRFLNQQSWQERLYSFSLSFVRFIAKENIK